MDWYKKNYLRAKLKIKIGGVGFLDFPFSLY